MTDKPAGWEPDPTGRFEHRYWDGSAWTGHVSNAGVAATDAFETADVADTTAAVETPDASSADDTLVHRTDDTLVDAPVGWAAPVPPIPPAHPTLATNAASGPRKGVLIGAGILAAVAALAAGLLLAGGDDGGDEERDRIRRGITGAINDEGDLSAKQANCIADAIIDAVGVDRLKDVDFTAEEPPTDIEDDVANAAFTSLAKCDIDLSSMMDVDAMDGSAPFGAGANLPPGFRDQLAEIYETSMGLPREKARCLAEKIFSAVESGDMSEAEAMSEFFDYFAECDIDMSELNDD